jgi:leucyl-tRNA synthetase
MEYRFKETEERWQREWAQKGVFRAANKSTKPGYYVLDMFPYPSGAGLHVGHPLGYIASDIVARYKRITGYNVLHPMGYDSFGLPAEQYAIQTGQHPAITTKANIARYREQLDKMGFSFDWEREVRTSDPSYYKWTQWIFTLLFHSWYNLENDKAEKIDSLVKYFESAGTSRIRAACEQTEQFTAEQWTSFDEEKQQRILMNYRLAYMSEAMVNWCPALGTVLANEEVKDGLSERGGYPVERKLMPQWSLRITAYAERLLKGLDDIDWSEALKESQRNWIGKSEGSSVEFKLEKGGIIEVFTTRPDTIYGATFITLAPEHELVDMITTKEYRQQVNDYIHKAKSRSERERMADVKKISGQFTGAYALHPFTGTKIPVWIGDYVLAGYGTGAVMAVPGHDSRDYAFAKYFNLPIIEVVAGGDISQEAYEEKRGTMINSDILNGLEVKQAIRKIIDEIERRSLGKGKTNYRLRDAIFGRQRYWGEPIPVYYKNGIPYTIPFDELPLELPQIDKYLPTKTGEPPLARASAEWKYQGKYEYEHTTMPGWAGSSWYFLRYMDPKNDQAFASKEALDYWKNVDLYIGGSEHATGHLLYVRFWTKFLFDLGYLTITEPAKKLINQGMIQGTSAFIYRFGGIDFQKKFNKGVFLTKSLANRFLNNSLSINEYIQLCNTQLGFEINDDQKAFIETAFEAPYLGLQRIDIRVVSGNDQLNIDELKKLNFEFNNSHFLLENNGTFITYREVEKMSKSKWNIVNPDDIIDQYGADCLRLYEMFLGPLEQSKPWNTNGITGVYNFLKKLWRLFFSGEGFFVSDDAPGKEELKVLHKTIKKIKEDIERYSFNTSVSNFMICVNELTELKCNKRSILEPLVIVLSPYAPHIAEELWNRLGHGESISFAEFPSYNENYLTEDSFEYPVSVNGKTRFKINLSLGISNEEVEKEVLTAEEMQKWLNGSRPKKVIVVPGRIVNVVV